MIFSRELYLKRIVGLIFVTTYRLVLDTHIVKQITLEIHLIRVLYYLFTAHDCITPPLN